MQTYLFYDIETTGLNKAFDQILHFAAIRTDLAFNEIERYELKIKLNPDVIPSPGAMITHHMPLKEIAEGISEYDAIQQIHQWINTPGTISLGYNTLGFDDEFLRFSFYRNLLPPYTHQFANQCSRMDIYPILVMYYLFKNDVLVWPKNGNRVSLKLENLNAANQFVTGRAHHAMVDVEATLALAKKLSLAKEMWAYTSGYFNKKTDEERIRQLSSDDALMILGKFGTEKFYQSIVLSLGSHYHYKNQLLWLRLDDKDFRGHTKETILENTYVLNKKLSEPGFLLPLKDRFMQHLSAERLELAKANKQFLAENPGLFQFITNYHRDYTYPIVPNADVESALYTNGFWNPAEELFCKKFHAANASEKAKLLQSISNNSLKTLALRILGKHFREVLSAEEKQSFADYLSRARSPASDKDTILDFKGDKRLTREMALQQIDELRKTLGDQKDKLQLLNELQEYLN